MKGREVLFGRIEIAAKSPERRGSLVLASRVCRFGSGRGGSLRFRTRVNGERSQIERRIDVDGLPRMDRQEVANPLLRSQFSRRVGE